MNALGKLALGVIGAGAASAAWGGLVTRNDFTVRYATTRVLAPGVEPIRVLHISDIHLAPWQRKKVDWLETLADLKPDLIVNTGDNVGHAGALPELRRALLPLAGVPGVFVHGSNDHFAPSPRNPLRYFLGPSQVSHKPVELDVQAMDAFFADELGWQPLDDTALSLKVNDSRLDMLGLGDAHNGWAHPEKLEQARAQLKRRTAKTSVVGVTHAPYAMALDTFAADGADMLFAGHTHGGQVCLPGGKALVTNCDLPTEQASGLSDWVYADRAIPLNVSAGVGTSIYAPLRLFCPPEVSVVTLLPRLAD